MKLARTPQSRPQSSGILGRLSVLLFAFVWHPVPEASKVGFKAVGRPAMLKINGEGAKLSGAVELRDGKLHGALDVDLTALTTGIELRDEHMKEKYLETSKFPRARLLFKGQPIALPAGAEAKNFKVEAAPFSGELELHGVTRPVKGVASLSREGPAMKIEAEFPVLLSAHGIVIPKYMGITVAEDVKILVTASGKLASAPAPAQAPQAPKKRK